MYKLKSVKIDGFWGNYNIETEFFQDFTFFHGENGTGKTTFISILQDVLDFDLEAISFHKFNRIELKLVDTNSSRKIVLEKRLKNDIEFSEIHLKIGRRTFQFPLINHRRDLRSGRFSFRLSHDIEEVQILLRKLFKLSFLSVSRVKRRYIHEEKREMFNLPIDYKLHQLMNGLTSYQLTLENEVNSYSMDFQKNVLKSMLFDEELDVVDIGQEVKYDLESIKIGLISVYKDLKVFDSDTRKAINGHIKAIANAAESINSFVEDNTKPVFANHVTPITLLKRTHRIIDLLNNLNEDKDRILLPIRNYIEHLHKFIKGKTFEISIDKGGGLIVKKDQSTFPYHRLSSGEKQLIILLTETLLQQKREVIFIADEPEISLHISWQRNLASAINEINPNAQIIFATHSPEIVGKRRKNLINMSNILKNGGLDSIS